MTTFSQDDFPSSPVALASPQLPESCQFLHQVSRPESSIKISQRLIPWKSTSRQGSDLTRSFPKNHPVPLRTKQISHHCSRATRRTIMSRTMELATVFVQVTVRTSGPARAIAFHPFLFKSLIDFCGLLCALKRNFQVITLTKHCGWLLDFFGWSHKRVVLCG
ncbi:hypothetical protein CDAR_496881 [Caerostris darwini]|uniref:Uncharacterized protein n=1 Tax=Caerostris darwini TaxID=1538125 RepID=A0AAV4U591_9ARAC|nr:hypothetical protein CDAR_496881 [Caerostris darwini]